MAYSNYLQQARPEAVPHGDSKVDNGLNNAIDKFQQLHLRGAAHLKTHKNFHKNGGAYHT